MLLIVAAFVTVSLIVLTTMKVEHLGIKSGIFIGLAAFGCALMAAFGGEEGLHSIQEIFLEEYPKFIVIPLSTVLIASMGLFAVRVNKGGTLGWFLWLICPLVGNFATTWALVPVGLGLVGPLRKSYPKSWLFILMTMGIFSMNFMAVATLLADPPQAFWAILEAAKGNQVTFFRPLEEFWVFLFFTWLLYLVALLRLGVHFGSLKNLLQVRPESWLKLIGGLAIAACLAVGLIHPWMHHGYNITFFLGGVFAVGCGLLFVFGFGHEARHNTLHWSIETLTIFVAFFTVAALAGVGLHQIGVSNMAAVPVVIIKTWLADNAAAFRVAYSVFGDNPNPAYIVWYGLHPSVVEGGASPFGNGPQILLFLVMLVSMGMTTVNEVLRTWIQEAIVFVPYLFVWHLGMMLVIEAGLAPEVWIPAQLLIGILAVSVSITFMNVPVAFQHRLSRIGTIV